MLKKLLKYLDILVIVVSFVGLLFFLHQARNFTIKNFKSDKLRTQSIKDIELPEVLQVRPEDLPRDIKTIDTVIDESVHKKSDNIFVLTEKEIEKIKSNQTIDVSKPVASGNKSADILVITDSVTRKPDVIDNIIDKNVTKPVSSSISDSGNSNALVSSEVKKLKKPMVSVKILDNEDNITDVLNSNMLLSYNVQIGAYDTYDEAQNKVSQIEGLSEFKDVKIFLNKTKVRGKIFFTVQSGPFKKRDDASKFCDILRTKKYSCFPVEM